MGLRDEIQADIAEAFDSEDDLADAVKSFTGERVTSSGEYDPITGTYPNQSITYTGRGVFGGFRIAEIDGVKILATDTKLTALQNEVTAEAPAVDDVINGLTVMDVSQDPASVSWVLQLRRT